MQASRSTRQRYSKLVRCSKRVVANRPNPRRLRQLLSRMMSLLPTVNRPVHGRCGGWKANRIWWTKRRVYWQSWSWGNVIKMPMCFCVKQTDSSRDVSAESWWQAKRCHAANTRDPFCNVTRELNWLVGSMYILWYRKIAVLFSIRHTGGRFSTVNCSLSRTDCQLPGSGEDSLRRFNVTEHLVKYKLDCKTYTDALRISLNPTTALSPYVYFRWMRSTLKYSL